MLMRLELESKKVVKFDEIYDKRTCDGKAYEMAVRVAVTCYFITFHENVKSCHI